MAPDYFDDDDYDGPGYDDDDYDDDYREPDEPDFGAEEYYRYQEYLDSLSSARRVFERWRSAASDRAWRWRDRITRWQMKLSGQQISDEPPF